jgi:nicotinamide mononucleotide (NMN) deamidase PncC
MTVKDVHRLIDRGRREFAPVLLKSRVRRALVSADALSVAGNFTGTMVPDPFSRSALIIKSMIGEPAQAALHYSSRFSANPPVPVVMPRTPKDKLTNRMDKLAGDQELFMALLLDEMGIGAGNRENQRRCGMAQAITESAFYVVMPTDLQFGVPSRAYYSDEEAEQLRGAGKLAPAKSERGWAEHADAWKARKRKAAEDRAINGTALFDLQVYPRDQVYKGEDSEGIKWAAVLEEIPSDECGPGTPLAMYAARKAGVPEDDVGLYGLWRNGKGQIVGGVEKGGPPNWGYNREGAWTLIKFFTREEMIVLVTSGNDTSGGKEIYRVKHGCMEFGRPANPVVEVPAMRLDVSTPGRDVIGPMSSLFAWAPLVNQLLTLFSNAGVFNMIPRWVIELPEGGLMRDLDGNIKFVDNGPVPGLDPNEAAAYPGTLRHLRIEDMGDFHQLLNIYLEQIAKAMPSPSTMGAAKETGTAWLAQQNVQQAQLTLQEPVDNHRNAVKRVLRRCLSWLKDLDTPVCFFAAPSGAYGEREKRGVVEFDPRDLTESFEVKQGLDTPDEAVVRLQIGLDLLNQGRISEREFYDEYANSRDARESIIAAHQQMIVDIVMGRRPAVPGTLPEMVAGIVQGRVHYRALEEVDNYALATADGMAEQAKMQAQQQTAMAQGGSIPGMGGGVTEAAGIRRPGVGMASTLQGQVGSKFQQAPSMSGGFA